ncbi:MAG: hypothetical protein PHE56_05005 [Bacteroidales bacterium]|nr:hypothetical protein [Bacteroidales bacterium]
MMTNRKKIIVIIIVATLVLGFRFIMGLSMFSGDDELQIYLIGLQSYVTETYPYYGPDVVYTNSQIPGGLQGLLISTPISCLGIPEAPFILLNILSFSSLIFFGWYLSKRIPNVPKWFMFAWILTCPWTLNYSTHIENPSYVIIGSILFFISVFELSKVYSKKVINDKLTFFLIGFSIFWIMQLHLSWVLTLPYLFWIVWANRREIKFLLKGFIFFILGSLVSISTLLPTLFSGFGTAGVESNVVFNINNLKEIPNIITRFFMFASYEVSRYIGSDNVARMEFLSEHKWVIPIFFLLLLVGFLQVGYFIFCFFRKKNNLTEWSRVKWFTILSIVILCCSFLFSVTEPRAHTFYILFPVAIWYSFYCYGNIFKKKIAWLAIVVLVAGILFHTSLFIDRFESRSLLSKRDLVVKAINEKDYTIIDVRRESKLMVSYQKSIWKKNSNSEFFTDFEVENVYFKPQNIVGNKWYQGHFSCKVDSIQPFSISFSKTLAELEFPDSAILSFWLKSDIDTDFFLVYEILHNEEKTWNYRELDCDNIGKDNWNFKQIDIDIPQNIANDAEIVIYFWMHKKSGATLYIDDWKIEFK